MTDRMEALKQILDRKPSDTFARYGLAMEYARLGQFEEALAQYRALLATNPDYGPAYFHGGQALERLGRTEDAKEFYRRGIEVTTKLGDQHARSEMQTALDLLG